jgi:hypothetical protein
MIALAGLAFVTPSARAHHGASAFDPSKEVTVKGTVTAFVFTNPHVQVSSKRSAATVSRNPGREN